MPANGRWDLIRRLKVINSLNLRMSRILMQTLTHQYRR